MIFFRARDGAKPVIHIFVAVNQVDTSFAAIFRYSWMPSGAESGSADGSAPFGDLRRRS